jgi:hypothetical protein
MWKYNDMQSGMTPDYNGNRSCKVYSQEHNFPNPFLLILHTSTETNLLVRGYHTTDVSLHTVRNVYLSSSNSSSAHME